jgi:hypothetical protein
MGLSSEGAPPLRGPEDAIQRLKERSLMDRVAVLYVMCGPQSSRAAMRLWRYTAPPPLCACICGPVVWAPRGWVCPRGAAWRIVEGAGGAAPAAVGCCLRRTPPASPPCPRRAPSSSQPVVEGVEVCAGERDGSTDEADARISDQSLILVPLCLTAAAV